MASLLPCVCVCVRRAENYTASRVYKRRGGNGGSGDGEGRLKQFGGTVGRLRSVGQHRIFTGPEAEEKRAADRFPWDIPVY